MERVLRNFLQRVRRKEETMKVKSFSIGSKNYPNEDRLAVQKIGTDGIIVVLADGMGGLSFGDLAAEVVTESVVGYLMKNHERYAEIENLHKALAYADQEVRRVSIEKRSNMGAAVAVAIIIDHELYCAWQGNVRIYVLHKGKRELLTTDHLANIGYGRTALTRCIKGAGLRDDVPFLCYKMAEEDAVFVCSDGLYKVVEKDLGVLSVDEISRKLNEPEDDASLIEVILS